MFSTLSIVMLVLVVLVLAFIALFVFYYKRHLFYTKIVVPRTKDWVFLEILVPKESAQGESSGRGQEDIKSKIAVVEQVFTTISSLGGKTSWYGPSDYLSLEIACTDKKISFYVNCPSHLKDLVEKQIHAQYPHAFIEEAGIYNPFISGGDMATAELKLAKDAIYPLRTYKGMESDPLNSLTNAMSKLTEDDGLALQFIIAPAGTSWQSRPRKTALEIQQGKNPDSLGEGFMAKVGSQVGKEISQALSREDKDKKPEDLRKDLTGEKSPIQLTPMQQEMVKRLEEKASRPGFYTNIRIVASSKTPGQAKAQVQNLLSAFLQYNMPPFNGLAVSNRNQGQVVKDYIFRIFRQNTALLLNTEELASLWHLPGEFIETPNINWLVAKKAPPPTDMPKIGLLLGRNIYRGVETKTHMLPEDRLRHTYIIGRSGTGKTEVMKYMSVQDIQNGEGLCIIDPHGDFVEDVLPHIPKSRAEDVILFEPADMERPMGLNMLEIKHEGQKDFAVQEMISIFYKLVTDPAMLGPMFEHNMRNAMLTLMADEEHPGTIVDIPRIFTDTDFQKYKVSKVRDPIVKAFWEKEMAKTSDFHKSEMLGYLVSKVGRFVENAMMRNIVGQSKSAFDFREIMDSGKILLVNLSKGKVGEINAKLLGLIIVSKIQMAALSRADSRERKPFYLYVDEFQNFVTDAFATILSEARKYGLGLIVAHQFLSQLEQTAGVGGAGSTGLRDAVFGNAGTMMSFRIGVEDAETMAKEFAPTFNEFDLVNVDRFNAFVKLLINNRASKPFNMATYPLPKATTEQLATADAIRQLSRLKFGKLRAEVENEILESSQVADMISAGEATIEKGL